MTFDTVDHLSHSDHTVIYPLEKYLDPRVRDIEYLNVKKQEAISIHESISTLDQIRCVLKLTDNCLKNISSNINAEIKTIHLDEPSYIEEDFDEKSYIKKIVDAKISRHNIVYNKSSFKLQNIFKASLKSKNIDVKCADAELIIEDQPLNHSRVMSDSVKNVKFIEMKAKNFSKSPERRVQSKNLVVQVMPSVNIRSELMEQKFPALDIEPDEKDNRKPDVSQNIAVIKSNYGNETMSIIEDASKFRIEEKHVDTSSNLSKEDVHSVSFLDAPSLPRRSTEKYSFKKNYSASPSQVFYNSRNYHESNASEVPSTSYSSSKKVSNLKKYGIAEVQQIYNPKSSFKRMESKPSYSFMSHKSVNLTGFKKNYSNMEYIPYSKLTVGGIKASVVQKQDVSSFVKQRKIKFQDDTADNIVQSPLVTSMDSSNDYNDDSDFNKSESIDDSVKDVKKPLETTEKPTKVLSTKTDIDTFDFIHRKETKDSFTQFSENNTLFYKSTQTSPVHRQQTNTRTITNDLQSNAAENIQNITTIELEKILSSFNSRLSINKASNSESKIEDNANLSISTEKNYESLAKNTQTSPHKTVEIMTSPIKMIDRNLSPIKNYKEMSAQTIPIESLKPEPENASDRPETSPHVPKSPKRQSNFALYSSSETQTDVSRSESSETLSLGEINLKILKKRFITILNQSDSQITTSISTSLNSDVQMNSKSHSRKSEGEISLRRHRK